MVTAMATAMAMAMNMAMGIPGDERLETNTTMSSLKDVLQS